MRVPKVFEPSSDEILSLVASHPLALLVSGGSGGLIATPLPLICEGPPEQITLVGHFARSNPHVEQLRADPAALAIFMGPHGYISPSWMHDRSQAPTWNFTCVQMHLQVRFSEDRRDAIDAVERLTSAMEAGRSNAWSPSELGSRYARLLPGIVPFRASVSSVVAKSKLGQNEREDVLHDITAGLSAEGFAALVEASQAANRPRSEGTGVC